MAETIRSLDRAALGFEEWTVTPIILQVHSFPFSFLYGFFPQYSNRKDLLIDFAERSFEGGCTSFETWLHSILVHNAKVSHHYGVWQCLDYLVDANELE